MNKELLISELEMFIDFSEKTKLSRENINSCGYTEEEMNNFPPNTPGVHPYWDDEMENIHSAKGLLEWAKTGVEPVDLKLTWNHFKCKLNLIYYTLLYPQYKRIIIGECGRGIEVLLTLCARNDWEKVYCYDFRGIYKQLVDKFFNDERVIFLEQQSCYFDLNLLLEDDYMLILTHSMPHSLKHFIKEPKITKIIKEGVLVDQTKHWREHQPLDTINQVHEDLKNRISNL